MTTPFFITSNKGSLFQICTLAVAYNVPNKLTETQTVYRPRFYSPYRIVKTNSNVRRVKENVKYGGFSTK